MFGRFGGVLGRFLVVLGLLGGSFGGLGGSWAALGRLLEGLGRLLGRLGSSWVVKGHFGASKLRWAAAFGPPRRVKMRQKSDPEGIKIDDENEVEKRSS